MKTSKIIGYVLFGLSFLAWLVPLIINLVPLDTKQKIVFSTSAIFFGEGAFLVSILILGKPFWVKFKRFFYFRWIMILRKIKKTKKS